jgi:hypothetical protein
MPFATAERATRPRPDANRDPLLTEAPVADWESPAGSAGTSSAPRVEQPAFVYRGSGDEHLRGQPCHITARPARSADERIVIMACGCEVSVPRWTLEPR